MVSHYHRWGSDGLPVRKVTHGWIIDSCGVWAPLGPVPKVFRTKREAMAYCDALAFKRAQEFRAEEA
jgi:hypothetical protein